MHEVEARKPVWRPPIAYLPRQLLEARRPVLALTVAWTLTFIPSLALGAAVSTFMPQEAFPVFPSASWYTFVLIVFAGPLTETLIMGAALVLLTRFVSSTTAVLISSIGWGIAHSTAALGWGLVIWWPFLIFSTLFLTWRTRSTLAAIGMATAAHGIHNFLPALLLALGLER